MAAATKTDRSATREPEWLALRIDDLKVAFHSDISVVIDDDLGCGHSVSGRE